MNTVLQNPISVHISESKLRELDHPAKVIEYVKYQLAAKGIHAESFEVIKEFHDPVDLSVTKQVRWFANPLYDEKCEAVVEQPVIVNDPGPSIQDCRNKFESIQHFAKFAMQDFEKLEQKLLAAGRWIPVTEEKPFDLKRVPIAWREEKDLETKTKYDFGYWNQTVDVWRNMQSYEIKTPTHWFKLPELEV